MHWFPICLTHIITTLSLGVFFYSYEVVDICWHHCKDFDPESVLQILQFIFWFPTQGLYQQMSMRVFLKLSRKQQLYFCTSKNFRRDWSLDSSQRSSRKAVASCFLFLFLVWFFPQQKRSQRGSVVIFQIGSGNRSH